MHSSLHHLNVPFNAIMWPHLHVSEYVICACPMVWSTHGMFIMCMWPVVQFTGNACRIMAHHAWAQVIHPDQTATPLCWLQSENCWIKWRVKQPTCTCMQMHLKWRYVTVASVLVVMKHYYIVESCFNINFIFLAAKMWCDGCCTCSSVDDT